jgi:dTDP-4-amino-4,6-dideoxygalactose transaminase
MPVSEQAAGEILSLPMYPHISEAAIRHVADSVAAFIAEPRWRLAEVG